MQLKGIPIKKQLVDQYKSCERMKDLRFLLIGNPEIEETRYYLDSVKKTLLTLGIVFDQIMTSNYEEIKEAIVNSDNYTSILVARPLHLSGEAELIEMIPPKKDVDMLTTYSAGKLFRGDLDYLPATAQAVRILLESYGVKLDGKKALVIGRSSSVGAPIFWYLSRANATVTLAHSHSPLSEIRKIAGESDVIVLAAGVKLLNPEDIKDGAVVIDCGYDKNGCGDLPFEPVNADFTPVPGGVGPLTTIALIKNALFLLKN